MIREEDFPAELKQLHVDLVQRNEHLQQIYTELKQLKATGRASEAKALQVQYKEHLARYNEALVAFETARAHAISALSEGLAANPPHSAPSPGPGKRPLNGSPAAPLDAPPLPPPHLRASSPAPQSAPPSFLPYQHSSAVAIPAETSLVGGTPPHEPDAICTHLPHASAAGTFTHSPPGTTDFASPYPHPPTPQPSPPRPQEPASPTTADAELLRQMNGSPHRAPAHSRTHVQHSVDGSTFLSGSDDHPPPEAEGTATAYAAEVFGAHGRRTGRAFDTHHELSSSVRSVHHLLSHTSGSPPSVGAHSGVGGDVDDHEAFLRRGNVADSLYQSGAASTAPPASTVESLVEPLNKSRGGERPVAGLDGIRRGTDSAQGRTRGVGGGTSCSGSAASEPRNRVDELAAHIVRQSEKTGAAHGGDVFASLEAEAPEGLLRGDGIDATHRRLSSKERQRFSADRKRAAGRRAGWSYDADDAHDVAALGEGMAVGTRPKFSLTPEQAATVVDRLYPQAGRRRDAAGTAAATAGSPPHGGGVAIAESGGGGAARKTVPPWRVTKFIPQEPPRTDASTPKKVKEDERKAIIERLYHGGEERNKAVGKPALSRQRRQHLVASVRALAPGGGSADQPFTRSLGTPGPGQVIHAAPEGDPLCAAPRGAGSGVRAVPSKTAAGVTARLYPATAAAVPGNRKWGSARAIAVEERKHHERRLRRALLRRQRGDAHRGDHSEGPQDRSPTCSGSDSEGGVPARVPPVKRGASPSIAGSYSDVATATLNESSVTSGDRVSNTGCESDAGRYSATSSCQQRSQPRFCERHGRRSHAGVSQELLEFCVPTPPSVSDVVSILDRYGGRHQRRERRRYGRSSMVAFRGHDEEGRRGRGSTRGVCRPVLCTSVCPALGSGTGRISHAQGAGGVPPWHIPSNMQPLIPRTPGGSGHGDEFDYRVNPPGGSTWLPPVEGVELLSDDSDSEVHAPQYSGGESIHRRRRFHRLGGRRGGGGDHSRECTTIRPTLRSPVASVNAHPLARVPVPPLEAVAWQVSGEHR